jgi:hypothetical protein
MKYWQHPEVQHVAMNPIYLVINNKTVTTNELQQLRWWWREFEFQKYFEQKYGLTHTELHLINWAALRIARGKMTKH